MKKDKLRFCIGCDNDYYNRTSSGCWYLEGARICKKKEVHINDRPPWNSQPIKQVLDCYKRKHYIYVDPERTS